MKRKGFTLVEMLAVIAIIAVLAIVVLPNVLESYRKSRRNNFVTEAREVYKAAKNQYIYDKAKGNNTMTYQRGFEMYSGDNVKQLNLSNRNEYKYVVNINSNGEVVYFIVQDDEYKIELGDNVNPVLFKEIQ